MTQEEIISEAFDAICQSMSIQDYEAVSGIITYLGMLTEFMTDSQHDQLHITLKRLEHLGHIKRNAE